MYKIKTLTKVLLVGSILLLVSCTSNNNDTNNIENTNTNLDNNVGEVQDIISLQPDYKSDLYGKVKSIEGNIFTIIEIDISKDPTANMSPAEKRAYMQALPQEQRMALKEEIQSATLGTLKVMIPVGIPMIKKELVGEEKVDLEANLADLKAGDIVNIWYNKDIEDRKVASFVKRSMRK